MSKNISKIQYLSVADKIYEVASIDWQRLYVEAQETDVDTKDVPESELWDISELNNEFTIRLINDYGGKGRMGGVIDFAECMRRCKG